MSQSQGAWIFLFVLALIMIIIGIQGNLGQLFAIVFVPSEVTIQGE
jgi:hypothetical protein